jgi:hypothetical protein
MCITKQYDPNTITLEEYNNLSDYAWDNLYYTTAKQQWDTMIIRLNEDRKKCLTSNTE